MDEHELREWVGLVKAGRLSRREFTRLVAALGLTAPLAPQMLVCAGVAHAQPMPAFKASGWDSSCWNLTHRYREA